MSVSFDSEPVMTQGLLEAITSAIGDELTLLAGFRFTRLTTQFRPEVGVSSGVNSASSADAGITLTLASGNYGAAVAGQRIRILSGSYIGRTAVIQSVAPTSATMVAPGFGVNLTNVSWEVVIDAETTMNVENVLDWPAAGEVYVDGQRYLYTSRTDVSLSGITYVNRQRARGRITCVAGALIAEGETLTINDGYGNIQVFEFDQNGVWTAGRIRVAITALSTATEVRDALRAAIDDAGFQLTTFVPDDTAIDLVHNEEGTRGNVAMSDTVANAGFIVEGMTGGTIYASGAATLHEPLAEVADYTQSYSSRDAFRRALFLDYATGADLNAIGRNLGMNRPAALSNDNTWREIIKLVAYGYRGTRRLIEAILDQVVGPGDWDLLEDATGSHVIDARTGLAIFPQNGSSRNIATVFLRRDGQDTVSAGKAFLDGIEYRPISSSTALTLGQTPLRLSSLRLARDPLPERLIAQGSGAVGTSNGTAITAPAASFPARVQPGDVFVVTSGPLAGARGTIQAIPTNATLTLGSVLGSFNYSIGSNFSSASWKIIRSVSNFRHALPSAEQYLEYASDPGTNIWEFVGTGGATEGTNASVVTATGDGNYTLLIVTPGQTAYYRHRLRISAPAAAAFEITARAQGTTSAGATTGLQWCMQLRNGARIITVGLIDDDIGFVDASAGSFISTPAIQGISLTPFQNLRVEITAAKRDSQRVVRLLSNGVVVATALYSLFPSTTDTELRFGLLDAAVNTVDMQIKQADWVVQNVRDYNNTHVAAGSLTGTPSRNLVDAGASGLFQAGDVNTRRVVITDWSTVNAGLGNPRGEWVIDGFTNSNTVSLMGPQQRGGQTIGSLYPTRFAVRGQPDAFRFPDSRGHNLVIENGPNAGTYAIAALLDPVTNVAFTVPLAGTSSVNSNNSSNVRFEAYTNVIEVATPFPFPADDTEVFWHISPVFAADAGPFPYEIVDTSTVVGPAVTLRQALPIGIVGGYTPLLEAEYTTVRSAQVVDSLDTNSYTAPDYEIYPFYLNDQWGYIRDLIDQITAAGVIVDYDSLVRDAAGLHLLT